MSNPSQHIIIYCNKISSYQELISNLTQGYVVTLTSKLSYLHSLQNDMSCSVMLLEIPKDEVTFLKILKDILAKRPSAKIILLDGSARKTTIAKAFQAGVRDYFPQPINHSLLLERVGVLLKNEVFYHGRK